MMFIRGLGALLVSLAMFSLFSNHIGSDFPDTIVNLISPVPGGVGPVTVAMLLKNLILAADINLNRK